MNTANQDDKKAILDGLIDLFGQNRRWLLFLGTGTSCALDTDFGMPALQEHLSKELASDADWASVETELKAGKTLEGALKGQGLSSEAKQKIKKMIGDFVSSVDARFRDDILLGKKNWVGDRLLKTLVDRLPPRNPRLSVITSNYDMLIEYACSYRDIRYTTGFVGELTKEWDWTVAQDGLNQRTVTRVGGRSPVQTTSPLPRVELFKVHGSINRFMRDNEPIECDVWAVDFPSGLERDLATPGDLKYEQYADNINTVSRASQVEEQATAFAVIGYGFNDPHLHRNILERVRKLDCPLVIMTHRLEDAEITELRKLSGSRVWILVAHEPPGSRRDIEQTLVYMPGNPDPLILDGEKLWSCDSFANRILGG